MRDFDLVGRIKELLAGLRKTGSETDTGDILGQLDELTGKLDDLENIAYRDSLTGLANRTKLYSHIEDLIAAEDDFTVMLLDISGFMNIIQNHGRTVAEELLRETGERLSRVVIDKDIAARTFGDEFVLVYSGINNEFDIDREVRKITRALEHPFQYQGIELQILSTIGITTYPQQSNELTPEDLVTQADLAMLSAREQGKNVAYYDSSLQRKVKDLHQLQEDLIIAIRKHEFFLQYQPIVDLSSGEIKGYEALIRWDHPDRGIIMPDDFLPFAERKSLILDIGGWVLYHAGEQRKKWLDKGYNDFTVSVNVSKKEFFSEKYVQTVEDALELSKVDPQYIVLELNEDIVVDDNAIKIINDLRGLGVGISIDDFGSKATSLFKLKDLKPDILKLDKSIITGKNYRKYAEEIKAVIDLASKYGITVIAEGVNTPDQMRSLYSSGCHNVQGYGIAEPLTSIGAIRFYNSWAKKYEREFRDVVRKG
ncbi:putative bifunctional diguanylate cyclase/phosphodiesterase [Nanoarchaeota archaeon]